MPTEPQPPEVSGHGGGSEPFTTRVVQGFSKRDLAELRRLIDESELRATEVWMPEETRQEILDWVRTPEVYLPEVVEPAPTAPALTRFERSPSWMEDLEDA